MKVNDLYASVTTVIVKQLEEGVPPWVRPWKDDRMKGIGMMPSNLLTGRLYSGSNVLLLWLTAMQRDYSSMQFCTYNQVNSINAKVRKGEKATHVIFTKHTVRKDEVSGEDKASTIAKTYPVFHVSQLENVPTQYLEPQQEESKFASHDQAIAFAKGTGAKFVHGGTRACYVPTTDEIHLPSFSAFVDEPAYWGTTCHEVTHWSGHEHRLDRTFGKRFGDAAYSMEELCAELGSAFLCARLGFAPSFRSASYIDSWLKVLKADNRAIFTAASHAGQAADYLWNRAFAEEQQREAAE
ncbi:zincin-like metallopeptidase domain-containing protein [Sinorhizobium medicae]|uniref:ArdC family protein n=1 Tax=Sinorhizobium medicae TaxID=110321 RepID=UPI002AF6CA5E|nr:zincin-like metallopeptidase domain-containing protein [Sinorhizobium medicae]WQO60094.1 zincin-like metallopeptidase domain-containing protein [Sinorhizobium medicae]